MDDLPLKRGPGRPRKTPEVHFSDTSDTKDFMRECANRIDLALLTKFSVMDSESAVERKMLDMRQALSSVADDLRAYA